MVFRLPSDRGLGIGYMDAARRPNICIKKELGPTSRGLPSYNPADLLFASQPERMIGFARLVFSGFAFLVIFLDPTQPARNVDETYAILISYIVYSAVLSVLSLRQRLSEPILYLIHGTDIATVSVLVHYTGGATSPFFTFLTFTLFSATMRWSWRGSLWTATVLTLQVLIASWDVLDTWLQTDSDSNNLILRTTNIWVLAAMLGYFGAYRERTRNRLAKLAAWPSDSVAQDDNPPLKNSLCHAANVLGSKWVLVLWRDRNEQSGRLAYLADSESGFVDVPALKAFPFDTAQDSKAFFGEARSDGDRITSVIKLLPLSMLTAKVVDFHWLRSYCTASFQSLHFQGRVYVLNPHFRGDDILSLTRIVAARIVSELERFALSNERTAAGIARERIRLARDLHDSVLQDLTAATLQLKAVANCLPDEVGRPLSEVSCLLLNQQRRIRSFVDGAWPERSGKKRALGEELQLFVAGLGRQWNCGIAVDIEPRDLQVQSSVCFEISQVISEAIANAVRHGNASWIDVKIQRADDTLRIHVRDNGSGLPTSGELPEELEPYSLKERIVGLGGRISLANSSQGTELSIEFPLR